jgi:phosphatidylglycerophosphate synthase
MNLEIFVFQALLCSITVGYILFLGYKLNQELKQFGPTGTSKYQVFFRNNKKYLSPNMISKYREIGGIPFALLLGMGLYFNEPILLTIAVVMIALLAIGDYLDGIVARACNMVTIEGMSIDARADKFFDIPILIALTWDNWLLLSIVIAIMCADIVGTFLRSKMKNPAAAIVGKIKTTLKFISMFILYTGHVFGYLKVAEILFVSILLISLVFAFASAMMKINWNKQKTA